MRWLGILPFLINWIHISTYDKQARLGQPVIHTDESHWSLLERLTNVPNDEIERFLPQVCNFALDSSLNNKRLSDHFETILIHKCATCLPFGLRVCGLLKASEGSNSERLFSRSDITSEERFLRFQHHIEEATCIGSTALTYEDHLSRRRYYYDYNDLLERLGRLGFDLRQTPVEQRTYHLRRAMEQCNAIIYDRMLSAGNCSHPINPSDPLAGSKIATWCPEITRHSLHLPLLHSKDKIQRIVRFVDSECTTLPSRDRCPYKVVVEVLTEDAVCEQDALFKQYDRHLEPNQFWDPTSSIDWNADPNHSSGSSGDDVSMLEYDVEQIASSPSVTTMVDSPSTSCSSNSMVRYQASTKEAAAAQCSSPTVAVSDYQQELDYRGGHTPSSPPTVSSSSSSSSSSARVHRSGRPHSFTQQLGKSAAVRPTAASTGVTLESSSTDSRITLTSATSAASASAVVDTTAAAVATSLGSYRRDPTDFTSAGVGSFSTFNTNRGTIVGRPLVQSRSNSHLEAMLRLTSPFSHLPGWRVASFVVKTGDDARKESLAMQVIEFMQEVFLQRGIDIYLRPYQIIPAGKRYGLIEYLEGTNSVSDIKKGRAINGHGGYGSVADGGSAVGSSNADTGNGHSTAAGAEIKVSLKEHFERCFGLPYYMTHERALKNFVRSLAGYSLVTYLLQVKDRHNANILIDKEGHMIHIDYGFIFGDSPGYNMNFESAAFKFTNEYLELMGGKDSDYFSLFKKLFSDGFFALRDNADAMSAIVQAYYGDKRKGAAESLLVKLDCSKTATELNDLISESIDSWRTRHYDAFQQRFNNIKS